PEALFFIKYEFWFNLMHQLAKNQIPFYFVSTIFRKSQLFFKPWGSWFAKKLKEASFFFVQNDDSEKLLHSIGIHQVEITGDTRFDRVNKIASQSVSLNFMEQFQGKSELLIAGSTWLPDEQLLAQLFPSLPNHYKLVIAPHQIDNKHIQEIEHLFKEFNTIRYSKIKETNLEQYQVLIVDTIGLLSKLYRYGRVAYIGGGFETGLHNILEAVVFGIPVFFGTKYQKFNEAVTLVNRRGAFSVNNSHEMLQKMLFFDSNQEEYKKVGYLCRKYVEENLGATEKVIKRVFY
ncbi:3-deoxy-D-manno-octulosonic acid transferase, partial [Bacteroidales bacterium OttesenSCG-928-L19]|nr:3-deoxy-D-manno-octulosonic acid transferase [Bacteroidales bacterium OttesenSCG-928-L19]MDL2230801.1 3-deoxy-D-manno-octulosonic acid transferase [Bacteroidales bacterium OttesenSCG-928-L19]